MTDLDEISRNHDHSSKGNNGKCLEGCSGAGAVRGGGSSHAARGALMGGGSSRVGLLRARGRFRGRGRSRARDREDATSSNGRSSSSKNRAGLKSWVAKAISGRNDSGSCPEDSPVMAVVGTGSPGTTVASTTGVADVASMVDSTAGAE
jgi:hypothetical protein